MRAVLSLLLLACLSASADAQFANRRRAVLSGGNSVLFRYTSGDSTSGATFSRTSTATYTDASGVIQTAASGVLRDSHYLSSVRTTLLEASRSNLFLRSEEMDNGAAWGVTDTTITANATAAPNGATTADLLTEGAAGTAAVSQAVTATANATYTVAAYRKRGNHDWVLVQCANSADRIRGWFNLATGTAGSTQVTGTAGSATIRIESAANGFYRTILSGAVNNGATAITCISLSATADLSVTRVNNATRYEWGNQFENSAAAASSYIPTTAATVTRAADSLVYTLGSYPTWTRWEWFYNSAGVLTETVTTGTGSYSFTPTVDRAYRKIVIAKETRDVAYFAGYK